MENSQINLMLQAAVLAAAGFISVQVWDLRKEVTQNAVAIEGLKDNVGRLERVLERNLSSSLKKENRYEFSKPHS